MYLRNGTTICLSLGFLFVTAVSLCGQPAKTHSIGQISQGKRVVAVRYDGLVGLLKPGDLVDVIAVLPEANDLKVESICNEATVFDGPKANGNSVCLLVEQQFALPIIAADARGSIRFAIHNAIRVNGSSTGTVSKSAGNDGIFPAREMESWQTCGDPDGRVLSAIAGDNPDLTDDQKKIVDDINHIRQQLGGGIGQIFEPHDEDFGNGHPELPTAISTQLTAIPNGQPVYRVSIVGRTLPNGLSIIDLITENRLLFGARIDLIGKFRNADNSIESKTVASNLKVACIIDRMCIQIAVSKYEAEQIVLAQENVLGGRLEAVISKPLEDGFGSSGVTIRQTIIDIASDLDREADGLKNAKLNDAAKRVQDLSDRLRNIKPAEQVANRR